MRLNPAELKWSEDGRLCSTSYDDIYFQPEEGLGEASYIFLEQNELPKRFSMVKNVFRVAELGFGSGLNFLLTWELWAKTAPKDVRLCFISFEKHPIKKEDLGKIYKFWPRLKPLADEFIKYYPDLIKGVHSFVLGDGRVQLTLCLGDIKETLPEINTKIDAWFMDGFAPSKNPEMWSDALFENMSRLSHQGTSFSTFTVAGFVKRGLTKAGFGVEKIRGYGRKREMLRGVYNTNEEHIDPKQKDVPESKDIIVLGAGIAGCSAAYAFARRGFKVTIIDRQEKAGQETSGNPIGIVYPKLTADFSPMGELYQHGFYYSRHLLNQSEGLDWNECGVALLSVDESLKKKHKNTIKNLNYPESFVKLLEPSEISDIAGTEINFPGLFLSGGGYLSPPKFCQFLLDKCGDKLKIIMGVSISSLEQEGKLWSVFDEQGKKRAKAEIVVVAMGLGTKQFNETKWAPLQSVRGQITYLPEDKFEGELKTVLCHKGYIAPVVDGIHYMGATFERKDPYGYVAKDEDHQRNIDKLDHGLPGIRKNLSLNDLEGRVGYRAATPDRLPMIGKCPDYDWWIKEYDGVRTGKYYIDYPEPKYHEGLYFSCGYGSHGIATAPLAGEIIAAEICGDPLPIRGELLVEVMPDRFIMRGLKHKAV